ncbi:MAG: membrane protein insertase YidC, partial [Rhodocyclaceae bacterium]|nr:membrane protein insertase YidC [Rhodocyclaceae bacterium]
MDNQRLILLLVFFFSIMMLWNNWHQHGQPQAVTAPSSGAATAVVDQSAVLPAPTIPPRPAALPGSAAATADHPVLKLKTDLVVAEIAAQGGDLVRLELLRHHATEKKDEPFVLFGPAHAYAAQSGLIGPGLPNHKSLWSLPSSSLELKEGENELRVALEAPIEGGGKVVKTYVFRRGSYLVDVEHTIVGAAVPPGAHAYFQLTRDGKPPEGANAMMSTFTGAAIYTEQEKFKKVEFKDFGAKNKHPTEADNGWVAMVQHYFFSAWLPASGPREYYTRQLGGDVHAAGVIVPLTNEKLVVPLYAGPQEQATLDKIAPGLSLVVDYGWLTFIAAPIFWVLEWIHKLTGNWGWSIILLTVLIKAIFFPLSAASYKSMAKMRVLTPKLMKLKETYADDRVRMNQEMMELYKREKVNPLGGCLPILVQIPVFIALYWVLL